MSTRNNDRDDDRAQDNHPAAGLGSWLAELIVDDAARARARAHWLERQAAEEGTFVGVLVDLAERGRPIVVQLTNGRSHRGELTMVGADFAGLRTTNAREVLVRQSAIGSIRTLPGEPATIGDRHIISDAVLVEALVALAEHGARVLLVGADPGHAVSGELRAVGRDVVTVRLDGGSTAYVAVESVDEVSLTESG